MWWGQSRAGVGGCRSSSHLRLLNKRWSVSRLEKRIIRLFCSETSSLNLKCVCCCCSGFFSVFCLNEEVVAKMNPAQCSINSWRCFFIQSSIFSTWAVILFSGHLRGNSVNAQRPAQYSNRIYWVTVSDTSFILLIKILAFIIEFFLWVCSQLRGGIALLVGLANTHWLQFSRRHCELLLSE